MISNRVEDALAACGRERVFENVGATGVAIRTAGMFQQPSGANEKWMVCHGSTLDEAGLLAAAAFSELIRAEGKRLIEWANSIAKAVKLAESDRSPST
jgi:primosomal replication protein N